MTNEDIVRELQAGGNKQELLEQLFIQNRAFIADCAMKYQGMAEFDDLMQEGFLGLCAACDQWDSCNGAKFLTYAYHHIKQKMYRYVQGNTSSIRVPEAQLSLIHKYEMLVSDSLKNTSKSPSDRFLILHLGINQQQLKQLKKDAEMLKIKSLDEPISTDDEALSLIDSIADEADHISDLEENIQQEQLYTVLWGIVNKLPSEQAKVIHERYENDLTIKATAEKLHTVPSQVTSNEQKAMRELRNSKNTRKLRPFYYSNQEYYSLGLSGTLSSFNLTWTSAQERAVMLAERKF